MLFALVANRAVDPASTLAAAKWARSTSRSRRLESMDDDKAYRALDLLLQADAPAEVQEAVFVAVADVGRPPLRAQAGGLVVAPRLPVRSYSA